MLNDIIKAGDMNRRLTLQSPTVTQSASKAVSTTWSDVGTYWASVRPASGVERQIAAQVKSVTTDVVTLRGDKNHRITPQMRFVYASPNNGRVLQIQSVKYVDDLWHTAIVYCVEVT